jgi:hypothetical protein
LQPVAERCGANGGGRQVHGVTGQDEVQLKKFLAR